MNFSNKDNKYDILKKENKKLKKQNKKIEKLKKQKSSLKKRLNNHKILIDLLINGKTDSQESPNYCVFCKKVINFKPAGNPPRKNAYCPKCHSLERDRFSYLALNSKFPDIFENTLKVLHFAPERAFYEFFKNNENIDYYPVDFCPEIFEKRNMPLRNKVNMENIPYDDGTFDFIYNFHVLEHVPDDIKAMGELYRVLDDEGVCLVSVPLFDIPETFQNDEYNTPELRLKHYGQEDHLRKYGHDFKSKLESVGFLVDEIQPIDLIEDKIMREIFGLYDDEKIFICSK